MALNTQPIRPAATVIIARETPSGFEIFMLKRSSKSSFAGGMYVFPGGRVDNDDHLHAYDAYRTGPSEQQSQQVSALGNMWRGFWIAAIRETFEEAGLLLAYDADQQLLSYTDDALRTRIAGYREPVYRGEMDLIDLCEKENLTLAVDHIHFFNRFVTPLGRPRRFDTRFFVAEAPAEQTGLHDAVETVDSIWISPQAALERNAAGEFDLMRVTQLQLGTLAQHGSYQNLVQQVRDNEIFPVVRPALPRD